MGGAGKESGREEERVEGGRDGSMLCLAEGCTCCVTDIQTNVGGMCRRHIFHVAFRMLGLGRTMSGGHPVLKMYCRLAVRSANVPLTIPETLTCDVFL